jgi:hypothetical protein
MYAQNARKEIANRANQHATDVRRLTGHKTDTDRRINMEREKEATMLAGMSVLLRSLWSGQIPGMIWWCSLP